MASGARREHAAHRAVHQKPISTDTLRVRLGIGATRARRLVKIIRAEFRAEVGRDRPDKGNIREASSASLTCHFAVTVRACL
ncbi:MAG: hypothetical protein GEV04_24325 [Actinophytocola sp.]|nr:hypothetical protein [Actinophytocola sp.]